MSIESAACAVAAADLGYPTFAEVIASEQLPPRAVATLMRHGMAKDARMVVAVIVLAASVARCAGTAHGGMTRQSGGSHSKLWATSPPSTVRPNERLR